MAERADQPTPRGVATAEGGHMIMGQLRDARAGVAQL